MPAIESLGPFEQLILTAVEALKASAYGPQVYEAACEFTGNAALLNCTKTQRRMITVPLLAILAIVFGVFVCRYPFTRNPAEPSLQRRDPLVEPNVGLQL